VWSTPGNKIEISFVTPPYGVVIGEVWEIVLSTGGAVGVIIYGHDKLHKMGYNHGVVLCILNGTALPSFC
jgi:hypothetical protein